MRGESQRKTQRLGLHTGEGERATPATEDVLVDRCAFVVSGDVWDRFAVALDRPAADVPGLAELMSTPTVLDDA
jgi:uncharacterized protein (DUF1778 family)